MLWWYIFLAKISSAAIRKLTSPNVLEASISIGMVFDQNNSTSEDRIYLEIDFCLSRNLGQVQTFLTEDCRVFFWNFLLDLSVIKHYPSPLEHLRSPIWRG
jgi:hypothetical protein